MKALLSSFVLACVSPFALAQAVHVVDAGGGGAFLDIQSAVDAATTGDLVLVRSGDYPFFQIDGKGVAVAADAGATVNVDGVYVANVGLGDQAVLSGLRFAPPINTFAFSAVRVEDCAGHVLVQDVEVELQSQTLLTLGVVSLQQASAVAIVDCRIDGSSAAKSGFNNPTVHCLDSSLYLHGTEVLAQPGIDGTFQGPTGQLGGAAVGVRGGTAVLVDCNLVGGRGGNGNMSIGIPGDGGAGGPAVHLLSTSTGSNDVVVYDSTLTGGPGGTGAPSLADGATGAPTVVDAGTLTMPAAFARRFVKDKIVRDGEQVALTFEGQPFDLVWHILALDANPVVAYRPDVLGAIHPGGSPFLFRFRGVLNGLGQKTLNITLTPTGVDYLPLYEQGLMYNATEGFVASNPSFSAFLDSTLP